MAEDNKNFLIGKTIDLKSNNNSSNDLNASYNKLNINNRKSISNINELLIHIKEYQDMLEAYKNASKQEKIALNEKISEKESLLRRGIRIDERYLIQYFDSIKKFVEIMGIDYQTIKTKVESQKLIVSPVELLAKGLLCNYPHAIAVDYSLSNFDENGNFIGFTDPIPGLLRHAFIHELLHAASSTVGLYMDSFSEAMTDYFAHKIGKSSNISGAYQYIERIFYMFGLMMGDDLMFQDYITGINEMKNLNQFVSSLGISKEEFKNFQKDMDKLLEMTFELKTDNSKAEEFALLKSKIEQFIYVRIISPYCSHDEVESKKMMEKIFSDSEETKRDLCEIHYKSTNEKKL